MIPADELGPDAREAGATVYIDQQLAGAASAIRTPPSYAAGMYGHAEESVAA
ncbi:MAG TPA: hypothetical protein VL522_08825 [Bordetella sp.]|jgi:hypothetical protein|nr:hypothetical protein [Bordetella sp.]